MTDAPGGSTPSGPSPSPATGLDNVDSVDTIAAVEDEIRRIPGVAAARIVTDPHLGHPVEVHVLASLDKHPKQLVRDIQSVAMAAFDLDIDRRIISVVQLEIPPRNDTANGEATPAANGSAIDLSDLVDTQRITIDGVGVARAGYRCTVEVALRRDESRVLGTDEGVATPGLLPVLVARATLNALGRMESKADRLEVESASIQRVAGHDVAMVTLLLLLPHQQETLVGSAAVRAAGGEDAVARAVLDATNRRIAFAS